MPHSQRWVKITLIYQDWQRTYTRYVANDPQINAFKRDAQNAALAELRNTYPNIGLDDISSQGYQDGIQNQPNGKVI